jgi:hypothetical protein
MPGRLSLPRLGGHLRKVGATSTGEGRWGSGSGAGSRPSARAGRSSGWRRAGRPCGRSPTSSGSNQLRGWRNERLAAGSAEALARRKAEAAELARLRRENKRLGQENEILKKAAAFFAREAVAS